MADVTRLWYGREVLVDHPELDEPAQATYVGYSGGPECLVRLAGTEELAYVPVEWVRRG